MKIRRKYKKSWLPDATDVLPKVALALFVKLSPI